MKLYPLQFTPISKYRMWGGNKLNSVLNKQFDGESIGESWEISDVDGDKTVVKNGELRGETIADLSKIYKEELLGSKVFASFGEEFPLLIKFIDAEKPLSIQVHPHDEIAKDRHNSFGKNEMWYIMDADEEAEIIVGFKKELSKKEYQEHLKNDTLLKVLNSAQTKAGDAFNIPTGRVHAIGAGVLLAEIQQTSDITYRIYDYNRVDQRTGEQRELHNDLALDVIDFTVEDNYKTTYKITDNQSSKLIHTNYFTTNVLSITNRVEKDYSTIDSFVILICVEGSLSLEVEDNFYPIQKGETILIPACIKHVNFIPEVNSKCLEVYL